MTSELSVSENTVVRARERLLAVANSRSNLETLLVEILPRSTFSFVELETLLIGWFSNESMFRYNHDEKVAVAAACASDILCLRLRASESSWTIN